MKYPNLKLQKIFLKDFGVRFKTYAIAPVTLSLLATILVAKEKERRTSKMTDLPEHLLPKLTFELTEEKEIALQTESQGSPVGLTERDERLISVLSNPKHEAALDLLLQDRAEKLGLRPVGNEVSAIPETDPKVENLVAYLETCYWMKDGYPKFEDLLAETGYTEQYMRQTLSRVSNVLTQRGLPSYALPPGPEDPIFKEWTSKYDPRFVLACNIIANTSDKRSLAMKLDEIEVSLAEWDGWLTNKDYYEYYKLLVSKQWDKLPETAKLGIIRGVHMGDLKTIQYYHEFTGAHTPTSQVVVNTGVVIQRVIEVLSAKLPPDMLNEIANDLSMDRLIETTAQELNSGG